MERSPNFAFHKQPAGPRNCSLAVCVLLGVSGAGLALVKHDKSDPEAFLHAFFSRLQCLPRTAVMGGSAPRFLLRY